MRFPQSIQDWFSPPPVNLALFRISFGLVCLVDVLRRLDTVPVFFSADGLTPQFLNYSGNFTLLQWLPDAPGPAYAFLLLLGCASVMLMLGYRTRIAKVLLFLGFASLHNRNPMLINAGDSVQMVFLGWSLLLPLGQALSLDAKRNRDPYRPLPAGPGASIAAAGYFACRAQLAIIYGFAALNKCGPIYQRGEAMHYILRQENLTTPFGAYLSQACPSWLLEVLTRAGVLVEISIPVLLFLPIWTTWPRRIAIVLIVSLHLFIESFGHFGLLSFYMLALAFLFIPQKDASRLAARLKVPSAPLRSSSPGPAFWAVPVYVVLLLCVYEAIRINPITKELSPRRLPEVPLFTAAQDHLHLDQGWIMFAPNPYTDTRFTVILFDYGDTSQLWPLEDAPRSKHQVPALADRVKERPIPAWYKRQFLHNYMDELLASSDLFGGSDEVQHLHDYLMNAHGALPFHLCAEAAALEIYYVQCEIAPAKGPARERVVFSPLYLNLTPKPH